MQDEKAFLYYPKVTVSVGKNSNEIRKEEFVNEYWRSNNARAN